MLLSSVFSDLFILCFLDLERYYNRIHLIILEQVPDVKSFDLYRPSWEFLKNSPKFATITAANSLAQRDLDAKKKASPEGDEDLLTPRPIGKKKAKRLQEEETIIKNVVEKLKENGGSTSGSAGLALAGALSQFASVFASGLQEWKERQAYSNASSELRQKYDDLVLQARIQELENALKINSSSSVEVRSESNAVEETASRCAAATVMDNNQCQTRMNTSNYDYDSSDSAVIKETQEC